MNGLLVIDKPGGMTSHDVVGRLRKITGERSIGHLGTLDPMATGVLPLLLGKYTRLAQYFSSAEKSYTGTIRLGFATETYDAEGKAVGPDRFAALQTAEKLGAFHPSDKDPSLGTPDLKGHDFSRAVKAAESGGALAPEGGSSQNSSVILPLPATCLDPPLTLEGIRAAASRFYGEMQQMPPAYSAKKIAGKPAYKLAREGKPVELKTATIRIASFEITALAGAEASFQISISAGGYVRSVAHELGQDMGCGAHLSSLRRTQSGVFTLDDAHRLEELALRTGNLEALEAFCIHPRTLLPEMPAVTGDEQALGRLRNGAQANLPEFSQAPLVKVFAGQRELVGIAKRVAGTLFQPVVGMG